MTSAGVERPKMIYGEATAQMQYVRSLSSVSNLFSIETPCTQEPR
jgi:hypothetical protein